MSLALPMAAILAFAGPGGDAPPAVELVGSAPTLCLLLETRALRKELDLDPVQVRKCTELAETIRERMRATSQRFKERRSDQRAEDARAIERTFSKETRDAIREILNPRQYHRLTQIALQMGTVSTFLEPSVRAALGLDEEQVKRIAAIQEGARRTMQSEFRAGKLTTSEVRRRAMELRKEGREQALAVLTAAQRTTWGELVGPSFLPGTEEPAPEAKAKPEARP